MSQLLESLNTKTDNDHNYHFTHRPPLRPYVCSTYRDLQEERLYLAHNIFPQLNKICCARGTSFKAIDLRWPLEEATIGKSILPVQPNITSEWLKLCLDYIDRSAPFFICILGHAYGEFVPESESQLSTPVAPDVSEFSVLSKVEKNLIVAANAGYPWVLEQNNSKCSFTELEIMHAAFLRDSQFQYFYFRDYDYIEKKLQGGSSEHEKEIILSTFASENEYEESRIWELKVKIVDKGLPVRFFKTKEHLGELVLKDWHNVIEKLYPISCTPTNIGHEHNLERTYHEAFAESLCKDFVLSGQSKKLFKLLDAFTSDAAAKEQTYLLRPDSMTQRSKSLPDLKSIFLLHGDRGCGKSTLAAKWLNSFRANNPHVTVISYFAGSNGKSNDIMTFMRHCITELQCEYFGIPLEVFYSNEVIGDMLVFSLAVEAFLAAISLKPCVLLLDGIDELSAIHGIPALQAKGFTWLPINLPHHCKIIMTTINSHLSHKYLVSRADVLVAELVKISDEGTRMSIFKKKLPMADKYISPEGLKSILNQKRKISPLQLAVLASELCMCRIYTDKSQCLENYLDALSVEQFWSFVIQRWVKDYSWTCDRPRKGKRKKKSLVHDGQNTVFTQMEGWVVDALCLLSTSRCGLSEYDILQLLKIMGYQNSFELTTLHWAAFQSATSKWIQEKPDGLLHFYHRSFRDAIEHLLLGVVLPINESLDNLFQRSMNCKRKHFHQILIKYFQQMDLSRRVYEELPWHLKMIGNLNELYRFLSDTKTLDLVSRHMKYGPQMKMDLIHYWQILSEYGNAHPAFEYGEVMTSNITDNRIERSCNITDLCRIKCFTAQCLIDIGKTNEAENALLCIETQLVKIAPTKPITEVLLWTNKYFGDLYHEVGCLHKAFSCYQKALNFLESLDSEAIENGATFLGLKGLLICNLAVLHARRLSGQHNQMLEDAIRHYDLLSPHPHEQATIKLCQGLHKFAVGDFSEAENYFCECLNLRCKLFGKNHILAGEVQEHLADIESHPRNNQYSHRMRAMDSYRAVIEIKETFEALSKSVQVRNHRRLSLSNTLFKAGELLNQNDLGGNKDAVGMLQRSLDLRTSVVGLDHPLSREVQCFLKEMNSRSRRSSKAQFGIKNGAIFQSFTPKSINHYKRFYNLPSSVHDQNMTAAKEVLSSKNNGGEIDDLTSICSSKQVQTLLQRCNIQCSQDEAAGLSIKENNTCENGASVQSIPVHPLLKFTGKRPAMVTGNTKLSNIYQQLSDCSTSLTGPLSSVGSLVPLRPKSCSDRYTFVHKSAWYHVPGRYPTLQTPLPPKRKQMREALSTAVDILPNVEDFDY